MSLPITNESPRRPMTLSLESRWFDEDVVTLLARCSNLSLIHI